MDKYLNRQEAGKVLAQELIAYKNKPVLILALPRGGVPIAYEIAKQLQAPLDVFIVRKLGVPGHEEFAMGAMAVGEVILLNEGIIKQLNISNQEVQQVISKEKNELARRQKAYRDDLAFPSLVDNTVILVDDGIATGATISAAIQALKKLNPKEIIVAVPVAEKSILKQISTLVDKVVCPHCPEIFHAVGNWYEHFDQTSDEEVCSLLKKAKLALASSTGDAS